MNDTEKTFTISGMSCGGCVASLTRVLTAATGITPVTVEVGKAVVRIDPAVASVQTVRDAVGRAGFAVVAEA